MEQVRVYDQSKVDVVINDEILQGFGGKITASQSGERWSAREDAHGQVLFARKTAKLWTVTVPLQQGSASNAYLSDLYTEDTTIEMLIRDHWGDTLASGVGKIPKHADLGFDKEGDVLEWSFLMSMDKVVSGPSDGIQE